MLNVTAFTHLSKRYLSIGCACCAQNKTMKKILSGTKKKKQLYNAQPVAQNPSSFSKGAFEGKKSGNAHRVAVLNKLFMRHITDLMATGESSHLFLGRGIEVNRVQVTPDFQKVQVFWLGKGLDTDTQIDETLQAYAGQLRHELSQLRVMGVVPKIEFHRDKKLAQLLEIDSRLANADFGDDYEPAESLSKLKVQLKLELPLEQHLREQILKLETEEDKEPIEEDIPPMPQNVLGLNREEIMNNVKKVLKKSLATHRLSNVDVPETPLQERTVNSTPVTYPNAKLQRQAFKDFLYKRELLRSKMKKQAKDNRPEQDYLEEEWELRRKSMEKSLDFEKYLDDADYLDEDVHEKQ